MSILRHLFRLNSKHPASAEECEYAKWSKQQLIDKVLSLEKQAKRTAEDEELGVKSAKKSRKALKSKKREFDFSKHHTRMIALKFAYLGWNYNGLAVQKEITPLPTVEGTILEAMNKCKLVPSMVPQDFAFSRCGRTDKGVSAMNQVISLRVRSNLTPAEQNDPENDAKEIQYVHILNQILPEDIKVSAVCLRPPTGFDARFSCKNRHYKYLFSEEGLNVEKMKEAAAKYLGEHDFRNFCKLDGSKQITNYKRTILSSQIMPVGDKMYCFDLVGSAFLWHQVRCMMSILFLIGQGLEDVTLIEKLLDVESQPQRPTYDMASEIPLILYDCKFEGLEWIEPPMDCDKAMRFSRSVTATNLNYELKATVSSYFKNALPKSTTLGKIVVNIGDGKGKVVNEYQNVLSRSLLHSVETVNARYRERKRSLKSKPE